jgi:hypothetical protein
MPPKVKDLYTRGDRTKERREVVLLSHVLPHGINTGYERITNMIVERVNGRAIGDMKDLVGALEDPKGPFLVIESEDHAWSGTRVVLDAKKAGAATAEVLKAHKIPFDRSEDLRTEKGAPPGAVH